jgi:hypothetical protein
MNDSIYFYNQTIKTKYLTQKWPRIAEKNCKPQTSGEERESGKITIKPFLPFIFFNHQTLFIILTFLPFDY